MIQPNRADPPGQPSKKVVYIMPTADIARYKKALTKPPRKPNEPGYQHYPEIEGLWGEWDRHMKCWKENSFFISATKRGPAIKRGMHLYRALGILALRKLDNTL